MPANVLEADPSLMESGLRIIKDDVDTGLLEAVINGDVGSVQKELEKTRAYRVIMPEPGVCIKILTLIDRHKFFINLCQSDAIPQPATISSEDLIAQLNSNEPPTYRIPMSISELRNCELKDAQVQCCDVVVHPQFLAKSQTEELFGDFLIQVMIEAIDAKYGIQLDGGKVVLLKNRKQLGTLLRHRIQNRDIETVLEATTQQQQQQQQAAAAAAALALPTKTAAASISNKTTPRRPLIEELPPQAATFSEHSQDALATTTRLVFNRADQQLLAEFYLPDVRDPSEIQVDVGEDRVRVQVPRLNVLREYFVEHRTNAAGDVQTEWLAERSLLILRIPVEQN